MSDGFLRPQEGADRPKGWDTEKLTRDGLDLHRQRVVSPDMAMRLDDDGAGTLYVGSAAPGSLDSDAVWKIKKVLTSGGSTRILYPNGSVNYAFVWDNRAGLTYA